MQVRPGGPGVGRSLGDAQPDDRQDQDRAYCPADEPVPDGRPPVPGEQHRHRVRRQHEQRQLVQVAAHGDQGGIGNPAIAQPTAGERFAGPGFVLGFQRQHEDQGGGHHAAEHHRVGPGGLRVVADHRVQRHDQAGEQPGPGRPGQPPGDDHDQPGGDGHEDDRRDADDRRRGADGYPAVQQQVVQAVHRVQVAEQVEQPAEAQRGRPAAGNLVVAHGVMPGQAPHAEHDHDGGHDDDRQPSLNRRPPGARPGRGLGVRRPRGALVRGGWRGPAPSG